MEQTLVLDATYEPLKVVDWQKAITLLCQGKVEIISTYDREVRSVSVTFRLPSVIRLLRYIRIKRRIDYVPFSRANIYARDRHHCQYCGQLFPHLGPHFRSCHPGCTRRAQGLGEHRHVLRDVQPEEGRTDAAGGRDAATEPPAAARLGAGRAVHDRVAERA